MTGRIIAFCIAVLGLAIMLGGVLATYYGIQRTLAVGTLFVLFSAAVRYFILDAEAP